MEYTLESTFERHGDWFIDDHQDRKVAGTIVFTQEDGGYLDLSDTLLPIKKGATKPSEETVHYQTIYGITTKGEAVSILGGFGNLSINANSGGVRCTERICCQKVVVGAFIPSNWLCQNMKFRIPALQVWLGQNTVNSSSNYDQIQKIWHQEFKFKALPEKSISLERYGDISWFTTWRDNSDKYSRIDFEVHGWMRIESTSGQTLDWFLDQYYKMGALISLLSGHAMSADAIAFSVPDTNGAFLLIQQSDRSSCAYKSPFNFFLTQKAVDQNFEGIAKKWFDIYDKASNSIQLAISILSSKELWLHVRFLSLMQALEGFHRSKSDDLYIPPDEYETIKNALNAAIPDSVSSAHRQSLKARIRYGNEVSLNKRLNSLTSLLSDEICETVLGASKVPRKWVDTRNYYTHWDEKSKEGILDTREMHDVCKRLELMLRIVWLQEVGVPTKCIVTALNGINNISHTIDQINRS